MIFIKDLSPFFDFSELDTAFNTFFNGNVGTLNNPLDSICYNIS